MLTSSSGVSVRNLPQQDVEVPAGVQTSPGVALHVGFGGGVKARLGFSHRTTCPLTNSTCR